MKNKNFKINLSLDKMGLINKFWQYRMFNFIPKMIA